MPYAKFKVFDEMFEGVQVIGYNFEYLYVNDAVAEHAKTSKDKLVGKKMQEAFPGIEQTEVYRLIGECLKGGVVKELINEFIHPDGETGYYQLRFSKIEEGVLIQSIDITDIKRAEVLLQNHAQELEEKVEERVAEINEKSEIIEKQKQKLALSNEKLEEFGYLVAHDLKAPLRKIKLLIGFIEDDHELPDGALNDFDKIKTASLQMSKLIDDILEYSKVHKVELAVVDFPLEEAIDKMISRYQEENVSIIKKGSFPSINADIIRFIEILENIVTNGLKYNQSTKKVIEFEYLSEQKSLAVRDNGIGIRKEDFDKVFQPFKRLHSNDEYEGTGAGMAIVKRILERQHSDIKIESEVGKGSVFYIDLKNLVI